MKNVMYSVESNILTIVVDLSETHGKSKSGKSTIIATTEGNVPIIGAENVKMGLNIYK